MELTLLIECNPDDRTEVRDVMVEFDYYPRTVNAERGPSTILLISKRIPISSTTISYNSFTK